MPLRFEASPLTFTNSRKLYPLLFVVSGIKATQTSKKGSHAKYCHIYSDWVLRKIIEIQLNRIRRSLLIYRIKTLCETQTFWNKFSVSIFKKTWLDRETAAKLNQIEFEKYFVFHSYNRIRWKTQIVKLMCIITWINENVYSFKFPTECISEMVIRHWRLVVDKSIVGA